MCGAFYARFTHPNNDNDDRIVVAVATMTAGAGLYIGVDLRQINEEGLISEFQKVHLIDIE